MKVCIALGGRDKFGKANVSTTEETPHRCLTSSACTGREAGIWIGASRSLYPQPAKAPGQETYDAASPSAENELQEPFGNHHRVTDGGDQPDRACSAHLIPAARSLTKLPRLRHSKSVSGSTYRATASMCRLSLPLTRPAGTFERCPLSGAIKSGSGIVEGSNRTSVDPRLNVSFPRSGTPNPPFRKRPNIAIVAYGP